MLQLLLLLVVVVPSTAPMGIVNVRTFRILVVQGCCCYSGREEEGPETAAPSRPPFALSSDPAPHMVIMKK
jgi:hypothetical protein